MSVLAVKVLLAPAFVVGASLAMRRFGAHVGGLLGSLPVVAGPILLVLALDHGRGFAADAATASVLGLVSLTAFVVVYGLLAGSHGWPVTLLAGWCGFLVVTAALSAVDVGPPAALAVAFAAFAVGLAILRGTTALSEPPGPPPSWDLPVRALSAVVLVIAITAAAGALGSQLSGLLAPFPVITSVLAAFTHIQGDAGDVRRLLRGFLTGFFSFALFCFTVAVTIRTAGIAASFLLALVVAVVTQISIFLLLRNRAARLST